jgi:hypothetical protein
MRIFFLFSYIGLKADFCSFSRSFLSVVVLNRYDYKIWQGGGMKQIKCYLQFPFILQETDNFQDGLCGVGMSPVGCT